MAYTSPMTAVSGATFTAAQFNTNVRDNLSAIWVGTTAGDLDYYTSSSAKSRLALGTAYQFLQAGATAPAWSGLHYADVYHSTTQSVSSGSATVLSFDSETADAQAWHSGAASGRITVGVTGSYVLSAYISYATAGGSGNYFDTVSLLRNGSVIFEDRRLQEVSAFSKIFSITFPIAGASATNYFQVSLEQNSGLTATVAASARFTAWRIA